MPGYNYGSKPAMQPQAQGGKPMPFSYRIGMGAPAQRYECEDCGMKFSKPIDLARHSRSHKNENQGSNKGTS